MFSCEAGIKYATILAWRALPWNFPFLFFMMHIIFTSSVLVAGALLVFLGASSKVFLQTLEEHKSTTNMSASAFFTQSITTPEIQKKFNIAVATGQRVRILLVPGHEPNFGGTEYKNLKERDMVVDLVQELARYLHADPRYEVVISRGKEAWNPEFQKYFEEQKESIYSFVASQKEEMARLAESGKITLVPDTVSHNDAPNDVAVRLYGINKWVNEYGVDIVIHVHFNDYSRRRLAVPGEYTGFAIYVPEKQYSNAKTSAEVSSYIFKRMAKFFPVSNLPQEDFGIIEDQELIAIGSFNTVDAASMLVEYGYVYEPQFSSPKIAQAIFKEMALQTYLGLQDFLGQKESPIAGTQDTTLLPFEWKTTIKKNKNASTDILALQAALTQQGFYPPSGSSKNDCPLSGFLGDCTRTALKHFQKEFNIQRENGFVGKKTRDQLNRLYDKIGQ